MRRILPRGATTALLLVFLAAGCADGDGGTVAAPVGTVAIGGVVEPSPTTAATVPATPDPPPTTVRRTTTSSSSSTSSTSSTTSSTTPPMPTSLALELADIAAPGGGASHVFQRVADDTGRLSMDVPVDWAERSTNTGRLPDGAAAPYVAASPDMARFLDGYDAAGMTVVVLPGDDDLDAALDSYRFDDDCTAGDVRAYDGERMSGELRVYRDCGGTDTDIVTVVGEPAGNAGTVLLLAQVREHTDLLAVDAALQSMVVRRR